MIRSLQPAAVGFLLGFVVALAGACGGTKTCDPSTCATGCCDANGACQPGTQAEACGGSGGACGACASGQQCSAGICTTPGGGGGGGGGGLGNYSAWCKSYAVAYCDFAVGCHQVSASMQATCREVFENLCQADGVSFAKGYRTFDATRAAQCLDAIKKSDCGADIDEPCEGLGTPNAAAGQSCLTNADCKDPATACGGSGCAKTCGGTGGLNEPCAGSTCDPGLYCDYSKDPDVCVARKAAGAACDSDGECAKGTHCDTGGTDTCVADPGDGQPCFSGQCAPGTYCDYTASPETCRTQVAIGEECNGSNCVDAAFCDFSATPFTCTARRSTGGTCSYDEQCESALYCNGDSCQPRIAEGGSCSSFNDCVEGTQCDSITRTCLVTNYDLPAGAACTGDRLNCEYPNECRGELQNPDGGVGTQGTCQPPMVGDACFGNSTCPDGAFCQKPDGGFEGECVQATIGSPCSSDTGCPESAYCLTPSGTFEGTCQPRASKGDACDSNSSNACLSPYVCRNGVCDELGDLGETCSGLGSCKLFTECINGTCQKAGLQGSPCWIFGICFDGACQGADPQTGANGTCGPPSSAGATCNYAWACASGICDGTCLACN